MQLIVQPGPPRPTAVHMVWLRVGSMDEVDGTSGVAHVLEHMMFKGSKTVAPGDFSRRVAALGGRENAFTSRDYTGYYQQIPAQKLEDVMRLSLTALPTCTGLTKSSRKRSRSSRKSAACAPKTSPCPAGRAALCHHLQRLALPPPGGGMDERPDAMTPADVRAFHRQWYTPTNAVVVGPVMEVTRCVPWRRSITARCPRMRCPSASPHRARTTGLRRIAVKAPAEQAYVPGVPRAVLTRVQDLQASDRDALALLVLSAVFSGYDGARLERALTQGEQPWPTAQAAPP